MKKIQKALSGLLAGLMLFTSVPVSALPSIVSDSNTEMVETVEEENNPEIITEDISTDETADDAESESTESTEEDTDGNNPVIESSESTSEEETTESSENQETTTPEDVSEPTQSSENEVSELEIDKLTNNLAVYSDDEEEEITDPLYGWDINLKLYDTDVNNGLTGVDELEWTPSPAVDSYGANNSSTENKTINMQINYHNAVAPMDYESGTLIFIVPNLAYNISKSQISATIVSGANDDAHTGYEWNFTGYDSDMNDPDTSPSTSVAYFIFTNAKKIEAGSNFEGSIQIRYAFSSQSESAETLIDECVHTFEKSFNAYMMTKETFDSIRPGFDSAYDTILSNEVSNLQEEMNYTEKTNELAAAVTDIKAQVQEASNTIKDSFDESAYSDFIQSPGYPEKGSTSMSTYKDFNNIKTAGNNVVLVFTDDSKMYSSTSYEYIKVRDLNTGEIIDTINYTTLQYQKVYVYENTNNIRLEYYCSSSSYCYPFKAYVFSSNEEQYVNMGKLTTQRIKAIQEQTDFKNQYDTEYSKITSTDYVTNLTYKDYFADKENMLGTNNIKMSYSRIYLHPWKKATPSLTETAVPIDATDLLPENNDDYIWVRYKFHDTTSYWTSASYPSLYLYYYYAIIYTTLPEDVVVISPRGNILTPDIDGRYALTWNETYQNSSSTSTQYYDREIYVGYPKSIYNEKNGNLNISNTSELWGPFGSSAENQEFASTSTVELDLSNFSFEYPVGDISSITKNVSSYSNFYYQNIIEDKTKEATINFYILPSLKYHGTPLTMKISDDILYCTTTDGGKTRLEDSDYYYTQINFPVLYNTSWGTIPANKYDCELWVRYAGETEYTQYASFKNSSSNKYWYFNETDTKKIVAYYFIINDMQEGLNSSSSKGYFYNSIRFTKKDIPQEGTLYNFCYEQVFTKNEDGELIWINQWAEENYSTLMTQMEIATYDKETYNGYVQRSVASQNWTYYNVPKPSLTLYARKESTSTANIVQDEENEQFLGEYKIGAIPASNVQLEEEYFDSYDTDYMISGYTIYDLLPKGVNLISTEKEIVESLYHYGFGYTARAQYYINKNGEKMTDTQFLEMLKKNIKVTITENWNSTGRTYVKIELPFDEPLFIFKNTTSTSSVYRRYYPTVILKFSIPYDSYSEYGNNYTNYIYADWQSDTYIYTGGTTDNGTYDRDAVDINGNGSITDKIAYYSATTSIISVVSTHQDVLTQTSSTISNFASGTIQAEYDKTYTYKLRVRTGQNDISNLVIYDNLERWTKNKDGNYIESSKGKDYWQGTLQSVDTSFAESKGYTVKVWYSENEKAGTLAEDTSWKEYSDSVDKTKVKSLAFQYLDSDGNPAILPGNSLTYVLINMKAPADEHIKTLAYNGCWTQWNAMDAFGQMVDDITGINSNIVKVALPNSVLGDAIPSIELDITKEILGTDEAFENLGLDPNGTYNFKLNFKALEPNENEEYVDINAIISNKGTTVVKLPVGSYLITEADDNYFDFVDIVSTMDPIITVDGVTFEKTEQGYVITVTDDVQDDSFYTLKVTNEIEPERHYEETDSEINLFNATPVVEEQSLLQKFFSLFE